MSPKGNPADRNHYKIDSDEAGFLQAKAEMRAKLKAELADLNAKLKLRKDENGNAKRIKVEKILDLFENPAGGEQKEKIVKRRNGTMILKDKSGNSREKIKLANGGKVLKIKDRNNKEILKVDLEKDEVKRDIGGWLEDLKKEVHEDDEVVKEVPKVRNGVLDLEKGKAGTYDLANDVIGGKAEEYSIKFPNLNGGHIAYSTENPSKLDFKNDLPKGTYVIEWRAKNKEGWSETATLTLNVTEKQEVVDEKAREEYNKALKNFREKEQAVQDPTLGDPNTGVKYNLEQVEGQVADAEEAYQAALLAAENFAGISPKERKDLDDLKNDLDAKKTKLENLQKEKVEKLKQIDSKIKEKIKEEIDKQKKAQDEQKKVVDQIKQKAENLENQLKSQNVAKESFEKIRDGQFSIEKETGFKEGNLDTLEGIEVEMQKHEQAVRLFRAEIATMNAGVSGLQEDFAKFEEEKSNSIGAAIGGTGAAIAVGAAAIAGPPGWAALAIGGGVMAGYELVKGWFADKDKPGFAGNGSFLGWLGNGNKEAYEAQSKKIKFEQNFAGLSQDLKAKEELLHTQAEAIYSAAEDPQRALDNEANKVIAASNIEQSIKDMYSVVGETAPADKIEEAKDKLRKAVNEGNSAKIEELRNKGAAGQNAELDILQKTSTEVLDQHQNYIASVNYKAADIGDYTFGALGKFLKKGKDIPVLGGVLNGLGKMSEGIGTIISHPGQVLKGIGRLVGIGDSKVDGMNFLERAADAWWNVGKGIVAAESWHEADSMGDYVNAFTETLTNLVTIFYSMGASASAETGLAGRFLSRVAKGDGFLGKVARSKFATQVGRGVDKFGRKIRNPRTTGREIIGTPKRLYKGFRSKIRGKNLEFKVKEDFILGDGIKVKIDGKEVKIMEHLDRFPIKADGHHVWEFKKGTNPKIIEEFVKKYGDNILGKPAKNSEGWLTRAKNRLNRIKNTFKRKTKLDRSVKDIELDINNKRTPQLVEELEFAKKLQGEIINKTVSKIQELLKKKERLESGATLRKPSTWRKASRNKKIAELDSKILETYQEALKKNVDPEALLREIRASGSSAEKFFKTEWEAVTKARNLENVGVSIKNNKLKLVNPDKSVSTLEKGDFLKINGKDHEILSISDSQIKLREVALKKGKVKSVGVDKDFKIDDFKEVVKKGEVEASMKVTSKNLKTPTQNQPKVKKSPAKKGVSKSKSKEKVKSEAKSGKEKVKNKDKITNKNKELTLENEKLALELKRQKMLVDYHKYELRLQELNKQRADLLRNNKPIPKEMLEEINDLKLSMDRINKDEVLLKKEIKSIENKIEKSREKSKPTPKPQPNPSRYVKGYNGSPIVDQHGNPIDFNK